VLLPEGVTGVRAVAFTGGFRSQEQAASIDVLGEAVRITSRRPLGRREGLTVDVVWDPGVVRRPTALDKAGGFLRSNVFLLIPVGIFLGMYQLWRRKGRDPKRRPIVARYEPPRDLSPAEVGTLIDNRPDARDVTATLVDLAVRGFLLIEEVEEKIFLGITTTEYIFTLRRPREEWTGLKTHEVKMLDALFQGGEIQAVALSELKNEFYKEMPGIRDRIYDRLISLGFYRSRPDKVMGIWIGLTAAVAALCGVATVLGSAVLQISPVTGFVAAGMSVAVMIVFAVLMPARTVSGTRALEEVLGFEEFLGRVEGDRYQTMEIAPDMFERFLPYAMALKVEDRWAKAFEKMYRTPPDWYRGGSWHAFSSGAFVSRLGQMSTAAGQSMGASPRSSGGSGFSGGGGGGGFGGGGGGGF
jgi:uncharacterized membrane protein